jgi:hypothetical protein
VAPPARLALAGGRLDLAFALARQGVTLIRIRAAP